MASRVVMPKLSDTMEEGKILRWLRQEGDKVETGQTLAEVVAAVEARQRRARAGFAYAPP